METKLKRGEMVTIYQNPISCERPEGKAKLKRHISTDNCGAMVIERWVVRFPGDCEMDVERDIACIAQAS